jgi:Ulp1 family protease
LAEQKIILHALADGHADKIIAQQVGSSLNKVTRGAMQSLKPGQWLEDEVVNCFFYLLAQRDGELSKKDATRKRNGFFNSFFLTKLLNEGHSDRSGEYEYDHVRNWSRRFVPGEDIFEVDRLFFVVNVERQHWVLAVVDMSNKKIQMYDSGSRRYNYKSIGKNGIHCLQNLFRYIQDEHLEKKNAPLPNANHWQLIPCQSDTPQQSNGKFASASKWLYLTMPHVVLFI